MITTFALNPFVFYFAQKDISYLLSHSGITIYKHFLCCRVVLLLDYDAQLNAQLNYDTFAKNVYNVRIFCHMLLLPVAGKSFASCAKT